MTDIKTLEQLNAFIDSFLEGKEPTKALSSDEVVVGNGFIQPNSRTWTISFCVCQKDLYVGIPPEIIAARVLECHKMETNIVKHTEKTLDPGQRVFISFPMKRTLTVQRTNYYEVVFLGALYVE